MANNSSVVVDKSSLYIMAHYIDCATDEGRLSRYHQTHTISVFSDRDVAQ